MPQAPDEDDRDDRLLVPAHEDSATPAATAAAGVPVLVELLQQQHRDASAGRAQSREVVRALTDLRTSQEYLGTALRSERSRGRWTLVALVLLPIAASALVWFVRDHVDAVRTRLDGDLAALDERVDGANARLLEEARSEHVATLAETVRRLESELERARADAAAAHEQSRRAAADLAQARERAVADARAADERSAQLERKAGAIPGLHAEIDALRARAAGEAARADGLERELRDVQRLLATGGLVPRDAASLSPSNGEEAAATPVPPTARSTPQDEPAPDRSRLVQGATRDPQHLAKITQGLNDLLRLSPGDTRYRFASVGGISGRDLLDVRLEGRDGEDRLQRTIEAERAKLLVREGESTVVLEFRDGELVRGDLRAPFFDGRYGLVLDADTSRWRAAGLSFLTLE